MCIRDSRVIGPGSGELGHQELVRGPVAGVLQRVGIAAAGAQAEQQVAGPLREVRREGVVVGCRQAGLLLVCGHDNAGASARKMFWASVRPLVIKASTASAPRSIANGSSLRPADSEPDPVVVTGAERCRDRAQAIVAVITAAELQAHHAEREV